MGLFDNQEEDEELVAPSKKSVDPSAYIIDKFKLGPKYSDEERQKIIDQNEKDASGPNWLGGLAALGAGLQGKDSFAAGQQFLKNQKDQREGRLAEFDKGRALAMQGIDRAKAEEMFARENDPASAESKIARETAIKMGMDPVQAEKLTAAQFKQFSPALSKMYDISQKALADAEQRDFQTKMLAMKGQESKEAMAMRKAEAAAEQERKLAEKQVALQTPYGLANTPEDAKDLKTAHESKKSFDRKIQELVDLREKYGAETANREAVARAKQLSKDLLLEYKNMAKLGVLSQADENIINAIIPSDPLEFQFANLVGQDPILSNLKKFQKDSDIDFNTKVGTRTREGLASSGLQTPSVGQNTIEEKVVNGQTYVKVPGGWKKKNTAVVGE